MGAWQCGVICSTMSIIRAAGIPINHRIPNTGSKLITQRAIAERRKIHSPGSAITSCEKTRNSSRISTNVGRFPVSLATGEFHRAGMG